MKKKRRRKKEKVADLLCSAACSEGEALHNEAMQHSGDVYGKESINMHMGQPTRH